MRTRLIHTAETGVEMSRKSTDPALGAENQTYPSDMEDFESLLEHFEKAQCTLKPGDAVTGKVLSINNNYVFLDIEYKSEGKIPVDQIKNEDFFSTLEEGSPMEAIVEHLEDEEGYIILSYEKISKRRLFEELERKYDRAESLQGKVTGVVKGGLTVDIGIRAFLPGSQIDLHPVRNLHELVGQTLELKIIQLNRQRRNIVVSRRTILEGEIEKIRQDTIRKLVPGNIVTGTVKNITDYGVFIDLGGVDGLLHKTDISWGRVHHPEDFFDLGQEIEIMILHFDEANMKVSLGHKQMESDPWKGAEEKYPPGTIVEGTITSLASYGIFVEIEKSIEGLVHKSEISWESSPAVPDPLFDAGCRVKVMVLNINVQARRLSLSIRRTQPNPWEDFAATNSRGSVLEGRVCNINKYGIFVEIAPGIVGRVFPSDISWRRDPSDSGAQHRIGDEIRVMILEMAPEKHRLTLGIKQLEDDLWDDYFSRHQEGDLVEGTVVRVLGFGAFIRLADGIEGLCHISEFADEHVDHPENVFTTGQSVKMKIIKMNLAEKRIGLSHRQVDGSPSSPGGSDVDLVPDSGDPPDDSQQLPDGKPE